MSTPTTEQHVIKHEDGWAVQKEGSDRVTAVYDTKAEAIERARELAENQDGEVYIIHQGEGAEE